MPLFVQEICASVFEEKMKSYELGFLNDVAKYNGITYMVYSNLGTSLLYEQLVRRSGVSRAVHIKSLPYYTPVCHK